MIPEPGAQSQALCTEGVPPPKKTKRIKTNAKQNLRQARSTQSIGPARPGLLLQSRSSPHRGNAGRLAGLLRPWLTLDPFLPFFQADSVRLCRRRGTNTPDGTGFAKDPRQRAKSHKYSLGLRHLADVSATAQVRPCHAGTGGAALCILDHRDVDSRSGWRTRPSMAPYLVENLH